MRKPKEPPRLLLTLMFAALVFVIFIITMIVVGFALYILVKTGVVNSPTMGALLVAIAIASVAVGTVVSLFAVKIPMKPMERLIYGMNSLAVGDYSVRLHMGMGRGGRDMEESFNIMAEELQSTEMLRSDFINNFSHEFKTPLVSIHGFARLMQKGNVPEEKQREYIDIIAAESARLADMATKVLNLTKLENQSILTDVSTYNLSEQIRQCILLLERKWTEKNLSVSADFDEYQVTANQEMMRQVWINLLENAVKFASTGGELAVSIEKTDEGLAVAVSDTGEMIPEDEQSRIFRKFYQTDASHASSGNGIGLAIVQRIVTLHDGSVSVLSDEKRTTFTVYLPLEA